MEMLTEEEVAVVAGSWGSATVTGDRWDDFYNYLRDLMTEPYSSGGGGGGGGGSSSSGGPDTNEPDCATTNRVSGLAPPDNARYFIPENVDGDDLIAMLAHLSAYAQSHSAASLLGEFKAMYDNPAHDHFMDFKDWGGAGGPSGSMSGGTTTYFSEAAGEMVTGSVFEAFGNFWYGFAGTIAGITADVLYGAAALMQEGNTGWIPVDGLEDRPHVTAGIAAARKFKLDKETAFAVEKQSCGTTSTMENINGPELGAFADASTAFGEDNHVEMMSWVETRFNEYVQMA